MATKIRSPFRTHHLLQHPPLLSSHTTPFFPARSSQLIPGPDSPAPRHAHGDARSSGLPQEAAAPPPRPLTADRSSSYPTSLREPTSEGFPSTELRSLYRTVARCHRPPFSPLPSLTSSETEDAWARSGSPRPKSRSTSPGLSVSTEIPADSSSQIYRYPYVCLRAPHPLLVLAGDSRSPSLYPVPWEPIFKENF